MEICFEEDSKHFVLSLQAMWMAVPLETCMVFNGRAQWCVGTIRSPSVSPLLPAAAVLTTACECLSKMHIDEDWIKNTKTIFSHYLDAVFILKA